MKMPAISGKTSAQGLLRFLL